MLINLLLFVLFTAWGFLTFCYIYNRSHTVEWDIYAYLYILFCEGLRTFGLIFILYVVKFIVWLTGGTL